MDCFRGISLSKKTKIDQENMCMSHPVQCFTQTPMTFALRALRNDTEDIMIEDLELS